jgi:Protein of unknown function (DUF3298)
VQDISCFIYAYKARIGELQENKPLDNWHWLITTRGQSSRPEILTPTTAEQAWNKAVAVQVKQRDHNAAEELASCKQGADPDRAENMEVDADSKIVAANSHLIAMTFTVFEDCGGAHPDTSFENWEWSLDLNRTVTPDDVFRAGSNWQPFVTAEITRQLLASDIGQYLWQGKQLADALNDAVSSTKQWTLTRDGIDIQFEQYQVTAYAFGMPQIFIPWKDMGPYLKPDWKPELLPARIPVPSP